MLVFKFGGASIKDAASIRSLLPLVKKHQSEKIVLVFSAMGKMTNAFEELLRLYRNKQAGRTSHLNFIKEYHFKIVNELFPKNHSIGNELESYFNTLEKKLFGIEKQTYDFAYDQTVSFGELLSSRIISAYLKYKRMENSWLDASEVLITNDKFRDAQPNMELTLKAVNKHLKPLTEKCELVVTQGFIGGTTSGFRTTIGREGSDYSAAILANVLDADYLTVWKDVSGILNADPKQFSAARNLPHISYHETVELAFYGASVIHPRTLQPLKAKSIPLYVRSFLKPDNYSCIDSKGTADGDVPSFIIREKQILFTIASRDFSFIDAEKLSGILKLFNRFHFHIRLLQNSALNFSLVADENLLQLDDLLNELQAEFKVKYNRGLSLLSVRHFKGNALNQLFLNSPVLLEMHNRMTQQFVMESEVLQQKIQEINRLV